MQNKRLNKQRHSFVTLLFFGLFLLGGACTSSTSETDPTETTITDATEVEPLRTVKQYYTLVAPPNPAAVLVLYPCFPCNAENTQVEFPIEEKALANNVAVLYMEFNYRLMLTLGEKELLAEELKIIFQEHQLPTNNIYMGGFSGGGNVTFLLGNYLLETQHTIQPKGVFMVDSPIDLVALFYVAEHNVEANFSAGAVQESSFFIEEFTNAFGHPDTALAAYEAASPYTQATNNTSNLEALMAIKLRLYTEPDSLWWETNRMTAYAQTNAYSIENMAKALQEQGGTKVEHITSTNRGYRADGTRHPHSWRLIEENELIRWMLAP